MSEAKLKPIAKAVRQEPAATFTDTPAAVEALLRTLGKFGWTQTRVAIELGRAERSLRNWADGVTSISHDDFVRLEALAADVSRTCRTG